MLDPAVTFRADGGGKALAVASSRSRAPRRVAGYPGCSWTALARNMDLELREAHRQPSSRPDRHKRLCERVVTVFSFTIDAQRIVAIDAVRNPEKLRHVRGA